MNFFDKNLLEVAFLYEREKPFFNYCSLRKGGDPNLTKITAATPQWLLADVYMDISTRKTGSSRKEFNRMLDDCTSHKLDIIFTKSISRFGRDTVETIEALSKLKNVGVRVIFEQEEFDTANTDSDLMISIIESFAQAENESRSENIK